MICSFFKTLFREECSSQMKVHEDGKGGGPLPIMERKANHWAEIFINIFVFFLNFFCLPPLSCSDVVSYSSAPAETIRLWDVYRVQAWKAIHHSSELVFIRSAGAPGDVKSCGWWYEKRTAMEKESWKLSLFSINWFYLCEYICVMCASSENLFAHHQTLIRPRSLIKRSQFYQHFILTTYQQLMQQQQHSKVFLDTQNKLSTENMINQKCWKKKVKTVGFNDDDVVCGIRRDDTLSFSFTHQEIPHRRETRPWRLYVCNLLNYAHTTYTVV